MVAVFIPQAGVRQSLHPPGFPAMSDDEEDSSTDDAAAPAVEDALTLAAKKRIEEEQKEARKLEATRKREEAMRKKQELMEKGSWFSEVRRSIARRSRVSRGPHELSTAQAVASPTPAVASAPSAAYYVKNGFYKRTAFMRNSLAGQKDEDKDGYTSLYGMQQPSTDDELSQQQPAWATKRLRRVATRRSMVRTTQAPTGSDTKNRRSLAGRVVDGASMLIGRRPQAQGRGEDREVDAAIHSSSSIPSLALELCREDSTSADKSLAVPVAWDRCTLKIEPTQICLDDDGGHYTRRTFSATDLARVSLELVVRRLDGSMLRLRLPLDQTEGAEAEERRRSTQQLCEAYGRLEEMAADNFGPEQV